MRVLIVAALFACASAAPSGSLTPLVAPVPGVVAKTLLAPAVVAPAVVAPGLVAPGVVTKGVVAPGVVAIPGVPVAPVNSGDLQAALIDAKVQTEDLLRSVADKQREAAEQAVVDTSEKVIEANDQVQEKAVETFWADQEKKWQAYDAVQTAQAQLDGKIASSSDVVAKSLVVPGLTAVVSGYPYLIAPQVVAPALKAQIVDARPEDKQELLKTDEKVEENKSDSVQVESASVKTGEAEKEAPKYVVGQTPLLASLPLSAGLAPQVWAAGLGAVVPLGAHVVAPAVVNTVW